MGYDLRTFQRIQALGAPTFPNTFLSRKDMVHRFHPRAVHQLSTLNHSSCALCSSEQILLVLTLTGLGETVV